MTNLVRAVLAAVCLTTISPACAGPPSLKEMIDLHNDLDQACRGGGKDDRQTDEACEARERTSKLIKQMGYCMAYPAYTWHRC